MESYLFRKVEAEPDSLVVEGWHKPGSLTRASGAWIHAAGSAMLEAGDYEIKPHEQWVWFAVGEGEIDMTWRDNPLTLKEEQTCFLPAGSQYGGYLRRTWLFAGQSKGKVRIEA